MRGDVTLDELEKHVSGLNHVIVQCPTTLNAGFRIQKDYRKNSPFELIYNGSLLAAGTKKYLYDVITAIETIAIAQNELKEE